MEISSIGSQHNFDYIAKKFNQNIYLKTAVIAAIVVASLLTMGFLFANLFLFETAVAIFFLASYGAYHLYDQHKDTNRLFVHTRAAIKELSGTVSQKP